MNRINLTIFVRPRLWLLPAMAVSYVVTAAGGVELRTAFGRPRGLAGSR